MRSLASNYITLVEAFELLVPLEEFTPLVTAVLQRLAVEGVAGLVSMQFYAGERPGEIGAIIRFAAPEQAMEHVRMISGWDEFRRFTATIKLLEIRVYGELGPEVEAWMRQFNGPIRKHEHFIAGFVRTP